MKSQAINLQITGQATGARTTARSFGGANALKGAVSRSGSSKLTGVTVQDYDNQKAALTIVFFSANLATPPVDNAAFANVAADFANCLGKVDIATTDYATIGAAAGAMAVATKQLTQPLVLSSIATGLEAGTVYAIVMVTGTPSYATGNLGLVFDIELD